MADIVKDFKPYKPMFESTAKVAKLTESVNKLSSLRTKLWSLYEQEEATPAEKEEIVDEIIKDVDKVIADAVSEIGASDPIIGELVSTAQALEVHHDVMEPVEGEEVFMNEAEEDEDKKAKDAEEEDDGEEKGSLKTEGELPPWLKKGKDKKDDKKDLADKEVKKGSDEADDKMKAVRDAKKESYTSYKSHFTK